MPEFDGFLIDLDGVVYQDAKPIAGALEVLAMLRNKHIPHMFLTNTTSKPRAAIVAKLAAMGIDIPIADIMTPVSAACQLLQALRLRKVAAYVLDSTREEMTDLEFWREGDPCPQAVLIGDIADQWSFSRLNEAFRLLMTDPDCQLIALGLTRYFRGTTGLQLDVGPFVKALEFASGRTARVMGKPEATFFLEACRQLDLKPQRVCMVGDDATSDVAAAQAAGLKGALVKTGKFQQRDLEVISPDYLFESIGDLKSLL